MVLRHLTSCPPALLTLALPASLPTEPCNFQMGTDQAPNGDTLNVDTCSLLLNGRRWAPAMGEFHFSRYPIADWAQERAKIKQGGIEIVASYVFWIHHEEIAGHWEWSGDKDLRHFIELAEHAGLKVIVRIGPWCHGEVRHGGLPDWLLAAAGEVRADDPVYLTATRKFYAQIATQLRGLLWKDGGPVFGVQIENEYAGPAAHLLTLKQMALDAGLDVPLYTRTGWPALSTPLPFGEFIPLYGVYAEGFWDRETTGMPGLYWSGFHFSTQRTDANIANEALGRRDTTDDPDVTRYPYLTCEIGGGMMSSYHRRIRIDPRDILATTLVKLGSGSNSPGYYMYHGGTNPTGHRTRLMESQDTAFTNWNDLPVKNYDFQAPLGACGQIRPHYRLLRRLHHFLHDFGPQFVSCRLALPDTNRAPPRSSWASPPWNRSVAINPSPSPIWCRSNPPLKNSVNWNKLSLLAAFVLACAPMSAEETPSFDANLTDWLVEQMPGGNVYAHDGALVIEDVGGCTVWYRHALTAPVEISYEAMVVMNDGPHDRLSDLNCFWMATDPAGDLLHPANPRTGKFADYDSLALYYVGYGGNRNTTTRFRRYLGTGERPLLPGHDLTDPTHLLEPNRVYHIRLVARDGRAEYWRDGELVFAYDDPAPLTRGRFGFRTVNSHLVIRNFKVTTLTQ